MMMMMMMMMLMMLMMIKDDDKTGDADDSDHCDVDGNHTGDAVVSKALSPDVDNGCHLYFVNSSLDRHLWPWFRCGDMD